MCTLPVIFYYEYCTLNIKNIILYSVNSNPYNKYTYKLYCTLIQWPLYFIFFYFLFFILKQWLHWGKAEVLASGPPGRVFPPPPLNWPLGPGPLDDDDEWAGWDWGCYGENLTIAQSWVPTPAGGELMSGVGVRLLRSKPPHGTAMGSHPLTGCLSSLMF